MIPARLLRAGVAPRREGGQLAAAKSQAPESMRLSPCYRPRTTGARF
jgi:hypothetical protein